MSDQPSTTEQQTPDPAAVQPAAVEAAVAEQPSASWPPEPPSSGSGSQAVSTVSGGTDRPELLVGGTFLAGFLAALLLKRILS